MEQEKILVVLPVKEEHKERIRNAAPDAKTTYCLEAEVTKEQVQDANIIIGNVTPNPARASEPISFMCPTKIRSTILYNKFTNCAKTVGIASFSISFPIGLLARIFSLSIIIFFSLYFILKYNHTARLENLLVKKYKN